MFLRAFCAIFLLWGSIAQAKTFIVNSDGDDNNPVDDLVTLREAIASANALEGPDTILLPERFQIDTSVGYSIRDDVEILGVAGAEAEIINTADSLGASLFDLESGHQVHFENLVIGALQNQGKGIAACGSVTMDNIVVTGFYQAFDLCSAPVNLQVIRSSVLDNTTALGWNTFNEGNQVVALFDRSLIAGSSIFVRAYNADVNVEIRNSLYVAQDAYLRIVGSTSMKIIDSALILSDSGTLLTANYESHKDSTISPRQYFYPSLEIIQSTIAGHQTGYPVIKGDGANVRIAHTTIADNLNNQGHLFVFAGHKNPDSNQWQGGVTIEHSVIDRYQTADVPIEIRNIDLKARFSFVPAINRAIGSESIDFDAFSSLYQGAPSYLADPVLDSFNLPYYLPQSGSPLIDAGDSELVAGEDGVPELEQRQSNRILGAAIDIGATEYNHEPLLNDDALITAYEEQIALLADPDEDIVLDLDNFVSDPDGHIIELLDFYSEGAITFEPATHTISGHQNAFKAAVMRVKMTDETGLSAVQEMDWQPKNDAKGDGGSGGGGGSLPATILGAIMLLGMGRARRRKITL